jgi:hypothetical protein
LTFCILRKPLAVYDRLNKLFKSNWIAVRFPTCARVKECLSSDPKDAEINSLEFRKCGRLQRGPQISCEFQGVVTFDVPCIRYPVGLVVRVRPRPQVDAIYR